jgi:hypothetical protein
MGGFPCFSDRRGIQLEGSGYGFLPWFRNQKGSHEISMIPLIKIFATDLMFCLADLIHWGFLDAFQLCV